MCKHVKIVMLTHTYSFEQYIMHTHMYVYMGVGVGRLSGRISTSGRCRRERLFTSACILASACCRDIKRSRESRNRFDCF